MSSKQALKDIVEYSNLPKTTEKDVIDKMYLNDEIGPLEFHGMATEYLEKTKHIKIESEL